MTRTKTSFLNDDRDESIVDIHFLSISNNIYDVFVVDPQVLSRALLLERIVCGQSDLVSCHKLNLRIHSLHKSNTL